MPNRSASATVKPTKEPASDEIDRTKLPPLVPRRRLRNLIARFRNTLGLYQWIQREHGTMVRYRTYFHRRMLGTYSAIMAEQGAAMRDSWKDGESLDMYKKAHELTLAISLKIFFGNTLHVDTTMLRRVFKLFVIDLGLALLMGRGLRRLILFSFRRLHRAYREMSEQIITLVKDARADETERVDLISYLARATNEDGEYAFNEVEVVDEALEMLVSSLSTTAVTLTWATYYLARNPEARERLEREIDETLAGRVPTFEDYEHLQYTGAVIAEVLRLAPPAYYIGRRATEDCTIGGYFIPAGSNVQFFFIT